MISLLKILTSSINMLREKHDSTTSGIHAKSTLYREGKTGSGKHKPMLRHALVQGSGFREVFSLHEGSGGVKTADSLNRQMLVFTPLQGMNHYILGCGIVVSQMSRTQERDLPPTSSCYSGNFFIIRADNYSRETSRSARGVNRPGDHWTPTK